MKEFPMGQAMSFIAISFSTYQALRFFGSSSQHVRVVSSRTLVGIHIMHAEKLCQFKAVVEEISLKECFSLYLIHKSSFPVTDSSRWCRLESIFTGIACDISYLMYLYQRKNSTLGVKTLRRIPVEPFWEYSSIEGKKVINGL